MRIDLHCHSKYSGDNSLEPEEVIGEAIKLHLDGVCFVEHDTMLPTWVLKKIFIPPGFLVFRGIEVSTEQGHLLVYGLRDHSWESGLSRRRLDAKFVVERVHQLGGICVAAHPFRGWDSLGEDVLKMEGLDAIETHNGLNLGDMNERALWASRQRNLPSTGGSDCHKKEHVGRAVTEFTHPVRSSEDLIREIRIGNCRGVI